MAISVEDQIRLVIGIVVRVMDTAVVGGDTLQVRIVIVVVRVVIVVVVVVTLHNVVVRMMVMPLYGGLLRTTADTRPNHIINSNCEERIN